MNGNQESKDFLFKTIFILFVLTIISGGVVWFFIPPAKCPGIDGTNRTSAKKNLRSLGEEILVKSENNNAKLAGSKAFKSCKFEEAIAEFKAWTETNPNDPEALIYLNNARVAGSEKPTLKIVVSVPLGTNLGVAQEIMRGVAQAQNDVNKSDDGINGKFLLVEIANDNNDYDLVTDLAEEFIKDETIKAVVGHNSSKTSRAAAAKYEQQKLVMVSPTSSASNLAKEYSNYAFRTVPPPRIYAESLAERIHDYYNFAESRNYFKTIIICFDSQDPYSDSFKNDFTNRISQLNSQFPSESQTSVDASCNLSDESFNPKKILQSINQSQRNALLLVASVDKMKETLEVAQANKEVGNFPLFGSTSMYAGKTVEIGKEDVKGMELAVPWHRDANNSFHQEAFNLWQAAVNWRTALAYDATKVIIEGLKESEKREGLQKALKEPDFLVNGATGTVTFDEWGDRQEEPQVLVIIKSNPKSEAGYSFDLLD